MAESEGIQSVVTQMAIQVAMAAVMVLTEVDAGSILTSAASLRETCRQTHGGPALKLSAFSWTAPDRYVEFLNFEMEVINILKTKMYKVNTEEKVTIITNWLGREVTVPLLIKIFLNTEKEACKTAKGLCSTIGDKFKPHHKKSFIPAILQT